MRSARLRHGAIVGCGSRETVLTLAERHSLVCHVGQGQPSTPGWGFHPNGTELPVRLVQGTMILPEAMLPARVRRRAA